MIWKGALLGGGFLLYVLGLCLHHAAIKSAFIGMLR